jgi:hypothetical protein
MKTFLKCLSYKSEKFPEQWKQALIIPIMKKANGEQLENYGRYHLMNNGY